MPAFASTRRAAVGLLTIAFGPFARSGLAAPSPDATIETLVGHIIQLLDSGELAGDRAIERLATTIGDETDLDLLGRLVLGRHWRRLDEAQQGAYLELFRQLMLRKFVGHLGAYSGRRLENGERLFRITGRRPLGEGDVMVESRVAPPDRPPIEVKWRLRQRNGDWVIIDLIVENVSLLISQRSEFGAIIERGGTGALLEQMREQLSRSPS